MDGFEQFVIIVALCVLLAALTIIAMTMIKGTRKDAALKAAACPDYWYSSNYVPCEMTPFKCCPGTRVAKVDANGSNCGNPPCDQTQGGCCDDGVTAKTPSTTCPTPAPMCYNIHKLGNCTQADFSAEKYTNSTGLCEKQKFATECKVSWEGVTTGTSACS